MRDSASGAPHNAARPGGISPIDEAAEAWLRRLQHGLSPEEEAEFAAWLCVDPRHEDRFRSYQATWDRFAPLVAAVQSGGILTVGTAQADEGALRRRRRWIPVAGLAAAASLVIGALIWRDSSPAPLVLPAPCEQRVLVDGSRAELNRGAIIVLEFTEHVRRVRLEKGEASFTVAKNPSRPFVVVAGGVEIHAVGTVFNVRYDSAAEVEVVVTEGRVRVGDRAPAAAASPTISSSQTTNAAGPGTFLDAQQSARVQLRNSTSPVQVNSLSMAEVNAMLAWQPKLLEFDDAPLSQIVDEFNRRNPVRMIIHDPAIAGRRMTASFRSDNLEAFLRLLQSNIGIRAVPRNANEILLLRK
jgi:transmembrane sensor